MITIVMITTVIMTMVITIVMITTTTTIIQYREVTRSDRLSTYINTMIGTFLPHATKTKYQ